MNELRAIEAELDAIANYRQHLTRVFNVDMAEAETNVRKAELKRTFAEDMMMSYAFQRHWQQEMVAVMPRAMAEQRAADALVALSETH